MELLKHVFPPFPSLPPPPHSKNLSTHKHLQACLVFPSLESVIEILEQPADVSGRVGGEITLCCRARRTKDEDKKLVYQWFEEGGGWSTAEIS